MNALVNTKKQGPGAQTKRFWAKRSAGEPEKANAEAAKVAALQNEVQKKQDDAMADLALAEPAIEAAMKSLDTLDKKDLGNCKTMATPPKGVDDVFAADVRLGRPVGALRDAPPRAGAPGWHALRQLEGDRCAVEHGLLYV